MNRILVILYNGKYALVEPGPVPAIEGDWMWDTLTDMLERKVLASKVTTCPPFMIVGVPEGEVQHVTFLPTGVVSSTDKFGKQIPNESKYAFFPLIRKFALEEGDQVWLPNGVHYTIPEIRKTFTEVL